MRGVIKFEIEFEHVDAWLTEKTELAAKCVLRYKPPDRFHFNMAFTSDASDLKLGGCRRDMRIQA